MFDYLEHYKSKEKEITLPVIISKFINYKKNNTERNENLSSLLNDLKINCQINENKSIYKYEIKFYYSNDEKNENNEIIFNIPQWKTRIIKPSLLNYLKGHCWLLSYLVERIHETSIINFDNQQRISFMENLLNSPWIKILCSLFNDNCLLASCYENLELNLLWNYFQQLLEEKNYCQSLLIINALPDYLLKNNIELQCFKDRILSLMSGNCLNNEIMIYIYQINDINTLIQTIMFNMQNWPMEICEESLNHALNHNDHELLPEHCKIKMNETLCRVRIFRKISPYYLNDLNLTNATWFDVVNCTEKTDPTRVIQSLINENKFELCLEWLEFQSFSSEIHTLITQDLFFGLLKNDDINFKHAGKLLRALPLIQSLTMCKGIMENLEKINALKFIVEFLIDNCRNEEKLIYRKALIGIEILNNLDIKEQSLYIGLIKEPLLMLEQLLMNCKFETLQKTLNSIHDKLEEANLSIENFDSIIRFYAGKALDFRVALQKDNNVGGIIEINKLKDTQLIDNQDGEFIMPVNVPTKDEWIPNDKAKECSSCKEVIFSMFNRRHHCRRCGRVVCAMCSEHRMRVNGYPNSVLVRVCKDCKLQATLQQHIVIGE